MGSDAADAEAPALADVFNFPEPTDADFDDDIEQEEKEHYKELYKELETVKTKKLHCTACDRHLGSAPKAESRMRTHPLLRTLVCRSCHQFYNSGEFERGDDGSELYCRWCGQGGQVFCCSSCPHVFCAKCVKRNLGAGIIKTIETTEDWKCLKCAPKVLWNLRATCWAILRYCELKNKQTYLTQDPAMKEKLSKECAIDYTSCCKDKKKKSKDKDTSFPVRTSLREKKEEKEQPVPAAKVEGKKSPITQQKAIDAVQKLPGIQVKKFASLKPEEPKAVKRPLPNPTQGQPKKIKINNPMNYPTMRPKASTSNMPAILTPMNIGQGKPRPPPPPLIYNGYTTTYMPSDNINLSLESLTQGLDMNAVAAMAARNAEEDDVVCTPDLPMPMEPVCEVVEEEEDDVQCVTPSNIPTPRPAPSRQNIGPLKHNLAPDNIVQMTDNDVTVNHLTGGLKFRVDPQTLSSNKMYRLPDGRIFAINPNPKMPGGYSATIVAVTDGGSKKSTPTRNVTFAAKVNSIPKKPDPPASRASRVSLPRHTKTKKQNPPSVEWFRFNIIDATDCLSYSIDKLNKLKKKSDTQTLRQKSEEEMKELYNTFHRTLSTSIKRFDEVKKCLEKGFMEYLGAASNALSDDDVEILNETPETIALGSDDEEQESQVLSTSDDETFVPDTSRSKRNKRTNTKKKVSSSKSGHYKQVSKNTVRETESEKTDSGGVKQIDSDKTPINETVTVTEDSLTEHGSMEKAQEDDPLDSSSEPCKDNSTETSGQLLCDETLDTSNTNAASETAHAFKSIEISEETETLEDEKMIEAGAPKKDKEDHIKEQSEVLEEKNIALNHEPPKENDTKVNETIGEELAANDEIMETDDTKEITTIEKNIESTQSEQTDDEEPPKTEQLQKSDKELHNDEQENDMHNDEECEEIITPDLAVSGSKSQLEENKVLTNDSGNDAKTPSFNGADKKLQSNGISTNKPASDEMNDEMIDQLLCGSGDVSADIPYTIDNLAEADLII